MKKKCCLLRQVHRVGGAEATSHVRDLDAGVSPDRASLRSRRGLVSGLLGQGAVAAVAAGVPPAACFRAETRRWLARRRRRSFTFKWEDNYQLDITCWSFNKWNYSGTNIVQGVDALVINFFSPPWRPSFAASCRRQRVCSESWAACPGSFGGGALVAFQSLDARRPVGHQPCRGTWERSKSLRQEKKGHLMRRMKVMWWQVHGVSSAPPPPHQAELISICISSTRWRRTMCLLPAIPSALAMTSVLKVGSSTMTAPCTPPFRRFSANSCKGEGKGG